MAPNDLGAAARRLRTAWRQLHGVDLFRSITVDLQVATGARHGDMMVHGPHRPLLAAASDSRAAALDTLSGNRLSPGWLALLSGAVVTIDDVLDGADEHDPWCALAVASNVISVLSVPLDAGYGTVAVVTLFSDAPAHFTPVRVAIAMAIAAIATDIVVAELARNALDRAAGSGVSGRAATGWEAGLEVGWEAAAGWGAAALGTSRVVRSLRSAPGGAQGLHLLRDLVRREAALILGPKLAGDPGWVSAAGSDEGGPGER